MVPEIYRSVSQSVSGFLLLYLDKISCYQQGCSSLSKEIQETVLKEFRFRPEWVYFGIFFIYVLATPLSKDLIIKCPDYL